MATITSLLGTELVKITVLLGARDGQPIREIFAVPDLAVWINESLPKLPTEPDAALTPAEEFDNLLFNFVSSKAGLFMERHLRT